MNHRLEYIALLLLLFKCSSTEVPGNKRCVRGYELSFFDSKKNNDDAKQACKIYGNSHLVKVDKADITIVIDSVISNTQFYIDGHADSNRTFTWSDGSKVNLRDGSGYQNWYRSQPNNVNHNEDCIKIGERHKQWKNTRCDKRLNYICQKDQDPCITVNSTTPRIRRCIATGSIESHVEWRRNGNVVSNTLDQTIYQTKDQGIANLYYENATIGDAGEYLCAAWIAIGKEKVSASEQVKVNGTPSIFNIKSFKCNSSLLIIWKPSLAAIGFPHRIIVSSNENGIVANLSITPTEDTNYFQKITELQSTTKYNVQITACGEKYRCSDDYAEHRVTTMNGMIKIVTNASIKQLGGNNTCIVSWEWPYITSKDNVTQFKIIIRSGSNARLSNEDIRFVNITTSNFMYVFEPRPSETYKVEIQSLESVGLCKTVRAIGSCIGKDASLTTNMLSIIIPVAGGILILLIVVIVVVLLVRKRKNTLTRKKISILTSDVNNRLDEEVYTEPEYCNVHQYEDVQNVQTTASLSNVDVVFNNINQTIGIANDVYENTTPNLTSEVNNRLDVEVYTETEYCDGNQYETVQNVQITTSQSSVDVVYTNINPTNGLASNVYALD